MKSERNICKQMTVLPVSSVLPKIIKEADGNVKIEFALLTKCNVLLLKMLMLMLAANNVDDQVNVSWGWSGSLTRLCVPSF